jgi:PAS domain S-box-containing protein
MPLVQRSFPGRRVQPSGRESLFNQDEIIVSKTDLTGRIVYANDVFLRVSHLSHAEIIGRPHNLIRHPDMPRCIFRLLWDTIQAGSEIFAYVLNMASNGDHYWVFAHVTPTLGPSGTVLGYHSNRRKPTAVQVAGISRLYGRLLAAEQAAANRRDGIERSLALFHRILGREGVGYDEFIFSV